MMVRRLLLPAFFVGLLLGSIDKASAGTADASATRTLTAQEARQYKHFSNLYTPQQFKTFVEQTWVSLPGGRAMPVLRFLELRSAGKNILGARIGVAAKSVTSANGTQSVQVNAYDFFSALEKTDASLAGTLTAPLAAPQAALTTTKQRALQLRIGKAITKALNSPGTPPPTPPGALPESPSPAAAMPPLAPQAAATAPPPPACVKPGSMDESAADLQNDVAALDSPVGTFSDFSSKHPVFAYALCLVQSGNAPVRTVFPIEKTLALYPADALNRSSARFDGTLYDRFDIKAPPALGIQYDAGAQAKIFGNTSDLVRFSASAQALNNTAASVSYKIYLGFSETPIASGNLTADNVSADFQDSPQEVIHFSKKVQSIPLGVLHLAAAFDITGTLSNDYKVLGNARSLYFRMNPRINATANGSVVLSALVSSAELDGTLVILDYTGDVQGAAFTFSDPFTADRKVMFADRYLAKASGTALKGSLALKVTLVCPSALKKMLCVQKTFPLYSAPGYAMARDIFPDNGWDMSQVQTH